MRSRAAVCGLVSLCEAAWSVGAPAEEALPPVELPAWEFSTTLRVAAGWKDNVLLSPVEEEGRAFARGEIEALAWKLPKGAWEALAFINGEVSHYFDPLPGVAGEQQWFAHAEVRWEPRPILRVVATTQGYFQDQVFDLSTTGTERLVARLKARGVLAGAEARVMLPASFSFVAIGQGHRSDYDEYNEDFDEGKAGGRLFWTPSPEFGITATLLERYRTYDDRREYTAGGRALAGTQLHFRQREAELKTELKSGSWITSATLIGVNNRDGASGYFDYRERRARLAVSWVRSHWKWSVDGTAARFDYRVQTVGIGFDPPLRRRDDAEGGLRGERSLGDRWLIFADARWERSRSNEANASYQSTSVMAGIAVTF